MVMAVCFGDVQAVQELQYQVDTLQRELATAKGISVRGHRLEILTGFR